METQLVPPNTIWHKVDSIDQMIPKGSSTLLCWITWLNNGKKCATASAYFSETNAFSYANHNNEPDSLEKEEVLAYMPIFKPEPFSGE